MALSQITLDYSTPMDAGLQAKLESIDRELRATFDIAEHKTAAGVIDLLTGRVAMVDGDREEYAASVAKVGILLAYFVAHPDALDSMPADVRHDMELMAKISSNEAATRFSRELGLKRTQQILNDLGFYDAARGGGMWIGKHYGLDSERIPSPVGGHSHAITVRQVLRFWLLLEQGKLISSATSKRMREIFAAPSLPHDPIKFVKGIADRPVEIVRKWGSWENWLHDSAIVTSPGRHYILVGITDHASGDAYLEALAARVDDALR